ncbi:MAG: hypothetical protein Kow0059_06780 [Candidatus Sumerlaeia bacterium]
MLYDLNFDGRREIIYSSMADDEIYIYEGTTTDTYSRDAVADPNAHTIPNASTHADTVADTDSRTYAVTYARANADARSLSRGLVCPRLTWRGSRGTDLTQRAVALLE